MLAGLDGVGLDADEAKEARNAVDDRVAQGDFVGAGGRVDGAEDLEGAARRVAGGVDREVGGGGEAADAVAVLPPLGEAVAPLRGRLLGEGVDGEARALRLGGVDPGAEVRRGEVGELEKEVGEVAFGVDEDGGDAVDGRLLHHREGEAGLAGARHAHDHRVGREVLRIVHQERGEIRGLPVFVRLPAEIKRA